MHKKLALSLLMLCPLPVFGAAGDADIDRLMPLNLEQLVEMDVSISTYSKQQMSKAPSVVSLITAEDIRATGATNLMDVLRGVPGVYVKQNLFAFRPLITLRGAPGTHVLLMVNGAPMRDLVWSNGIYWKGLPASIIERIEIIRGPGSALFGADASAGVINVITHTATPIRHSEAGLRAGSYDSQAGWLRHGGNWNGLDVGLTAELSTTDGHRPTISPDNSSPNRSGKANYAWDNQDLRFSLAGGHWRLLADYQRQDDVGAGLNGAGMLDPLNQSDSRQYGLALHYDNPRFAPDWGLNAVARYRDVKYSSGNGFITLAPPTREYLDAAERQAGLELSGLYTGLRGHALRIGGGAAWNETYGVRQVNPPNPAYPIPEKSRRDLYLFLQDVWTLADDWELTAGLRYDEFNDFGGATTPRLALVWRSSERLTGKLLYGEAFRAPSYQELYFKTAANTPNPNLRPKRSRTWELAFDYLASDRLKLGVNLYRFLRTDLISGAGGTFRNVGDFTVRGLELEAHWQATPALRFAGNLTLLDQDDSPARDVNVPDEALHLRMDWAFKPRWAWDVQAHWFGRRPLSDNRPPTDLRKELGSYGLLDTTLRYRHDRHWEFAVAARNVLDKDARDYSHPRLESNLPLPGRNFYAEVRYGF